MSAIIRILVLVAAVAAPAAAFGGEKVVSLDVDGRVRDVRTYASAAPDLLVRVGLETTDRDLVLPAGELEPGSVVRVRRAKPVEVVLDGATNEVVVHGLTVGEALAELGMTPGPDDFVFPSESDPVRDGMQIVVRNARHAVVKVDGKSRDVVSSAQTVGEMLEQAGLELSGKDYVRPTSQTELTDGLAVRIVRVRETIEEKRSEIPFRHREKKDSKLEKGKRKVVQRGAEGIKARRYRVRLEDGKRVSRTLLSEKVVREPKDEVVAVGTGQPAYSGSGRSEEGRASWFRADGLTAAHRTLPFGTVVRVTNLENGRTVNVVIRDRGPFIDGRVIDLSNNAFAELAPLGKGTIRVRISY